VGRKGKVRGGEFWGDRRKGEEIRFLVGGRARMVRRFESFIVRASL